MGWIGGFGDCFRRVISNQVGGEGDFVLASSQGSRSTGIHRFSTGGVAICRQQEEFAHFVHNV